MIQRPHICCFVARDDVETTTRWTRSSPACTCNSTHGSPRGSSASIAFHTWSPEILWSSWSAWSLSSTDDRQHGLPESTSRLPTSATFPTVFPAASGPSHVARLQCWCPTHAATTAATVAVAFAGRTAVRPSWSRRSTTQYATIAATARGWWVCPSTTTFHALCFETSRRSCVHRTCQLFTKARTPLEQLSAQT